MIQLEETAGEGTEGLTLDTLAMQSCSTAHEGLLGERAFPGQPLIPAVGGGGGKGEQVCRGPWSCYQICRIAASQFPQPL